MKLSIAWIFDHIKGSWHDYDVHDLVKKLNATTAEIEHVHHVQIPWDDFVLVRVVSSGTDGIVVDSVELKKKISLPVRKDAHQDACFLLKKEGKQFRWAKLADFQSDKEGLVPRLFCSEKNLKGGWRESLEHEDYILELDNKSVTNRPDLWGHRGIAREIAAILNLDLVPEEQLVADTPIQHYAQKSDESAGYAIDISQSDTCTRFAGIELAGVMPTASLPWMASRLARVGTRPIDAFVDMTNYVLYDIGHPMHAFDAAKIAEKTIIARPARSGEKLALLDDTTIELTDCDCVIADSKQPLSLAGIMGGQSSAVGPKTNTLFLEAAHFDATAIRLSAAHHKKRTESSIRFEKSLDPNNNTTAIVRYLKLLNDAKISYTSGSAVLSVGPLAQEKTVVLSRNFITNRLGAIISSDHIKEILIKLGFGVQVAEGSDGAAFTVTVPTFRATKDIGIKEDIVEEVGRFFGYTNIHPILPQRIMSPQDHSAVFYRRSFKKHCAYALHMREVFNYALYDEAFLHKIKFDPQDAPQLKNPVSENWSRLVTSLIPHLLKNIAQNCANEAQLNFFEWNRIWRMQKEEKIAEHTACSGIFYDREGSIDFYDCKQKMQSLFDMLTILVVWRKPQGGVMPWMDQHRSAELVCDDQVIGLAGMVAADVLDVVAQGNAFIFELDCDAIARVPHLERSYRESSKYQSVSLDVSMLVPFGVAVADLEENIIQSDARITDVYLLDVFEKAEWADKRSVTIRYVAQDHEKTMTSDEIEALQQSVHAAVRKHGVEVR